MSEKIKPEDTTETEQPAISEQMQQEFARIANSAVSSHLKRALSPEKLREALAPALANLLPPSKPVEAPEAPEAPVKGKEKDSAFAAMEARTRALETKLKEKEEAEKHMQQKELRREEESALTRALEANGVKGPRLEAAVALLYDRKKLITRNTEGEVGWLTKQAGYDEVLPLESAVTDWLGTEAGKDFLPARGVGGSGATAPKGGAAGKAAKAKGAGYSDSEKGELVLELLQKMRG